MIAVALLTALAVLLGLALVFAARRLPATDDALVDAIDALLPQTQCAQCGYPGCRPYARAVAAGAPIDRCPPGGETTWRALADLLGRGDGAAPVGSAPQVALIREADCIGCFRCVPACPVDAIVGAPRYLHTVLESECTGCGLCVPECPVDCIDLVAIVADETPSIEALDGQAPCIRCGQCLPACPAGLDPAALHWQTAAGRLEAAADLGLEACIECGLCDRVCPSAIPLAAGFTSARSQWFGELRTRADADNARARFEARTARLARADTEAAQRRAARIASRTPAA